ncbi:hypothetical protein D3C72_1953250 [compost metagenome]
MPVIDRADAHGDADQIERTLIGKRDALLSGVLCHDLEGELAAVGVRHPAVPDAVSGLFQLVDGHFKDLAVRTGGVGGRQGIGAGQ